MHQRGGSRRLVDTSLTDATETRSRDARDVEGAPGVPAAARRRKARRARSELLVAVLSPVALLLLWELGAAVDAIDTRLLPPPSRLAESLLEGVRSGQLLRDSAWSLYRITVGFAIGSTAGVLVGALVGISQTFRSLVAPLFAAMYAVPKTALLPLVILMFGYSETSKITLLALSGFFLTEVNTAHGVLTIPRVLFEVADDCAMSRLRVIKTVAIPGALPYIIAGLRMSWTVALIVVVVVEMQATTSGLGAFIMSEWRLFRIDRMMAGLFVLAAIGLISNLLFDMAAERLTPWKSEGK
jgi:ABC-type nitrate/sulfonate/bicarbonate transport system permease component